MDKFTVTSPIGLWATVLKPRVWHYGSCHLGFMQPEHVQYQEARGGQRTASWLILSFGSSIQQEITVDCLVMIFLMLLLNSTLKFGRLH